MAINEYLAWALGVTANVRSQASYATDPAVIQGISAGTAASALANKTWRQSSVSAAALAQFICDTTDLDMRDDGNIAAYVTNLQAAIQSYLTANLIIRPRLSAAQDLYLSVTGSDSADGLSPGTAWASLPRVAAYVSTIDTGGFQINVHIGPGTYTHGFLLQSAIIGGGRLSLTATDGNPLNTTISTTNEPCVLASGASLIQVNGFTLTAGGTIGPLRGGIVANTAGTIFYGNCTFGSCTDAHVLSFSGGVCAANGNYTITGSSQAHLFAGALGQITADIEGGITAISVVGSPTFPVAFAYAVGAGQVQSISVAITGASNGRRYWADRGGSIFTQGGGANYFPGTVVGDSTNGYYS